MIAPTTAHYVLTVAPGRVDEVESRIKKLNRRASKLHLPALTHKVGLEYTVTVTANGRKYLYPAVDVVVDGELPVLAGWAIVGVVDHATMGGNLVHTIATDSDEIMANYRHARSDCDHCNTYRQRNKTIVVNDGNKIMQVGSSCVIDFLGSKEAAAALGHLQGVAALEDEFGGGDESSGVYGGYAAPVLIDFLVRVAASIRLDGWHPKSGGEYRSTAVAAQSDKPCKPSLTDDDRDIAEAAREWARTLEPTDNFEHNLKVVASVDHVTKDGLCAYMVEGYLRHVGKVAADAAREKLPQSNEHIGDPAAKARIELTLTYVRMSNYANDFGVQYWVAFADEAGNIIKWRTGNPHSLLGDEPETGAVVKVKCRIKSHGEFKGRKETVISRPTVVKEK